MPSPPAVAAPMPRWRLVLLGRPALQRVDGDARIDLRPKDAALLALVALAGPLPPERVAAMVWPAADARRADTSLRQRLFRLRKDSGAVLVASGALLQLASDLAPALDDELARLADDSQAAQGEVLGELDFEDLPEFADWLRAERTQWHQRRDAALAAAAEASERDGALARSLAYAQRLVDSDPLAEHPQRRLMRLHYLRGDGAAAIAAFERFERGLKDELGTRPSAETIELLDTIERGMATLPAQRAVAPASLMRPPRLVGRERELAALEHAWSLERIFLVEGEAGIGKSRLLQALAASRDGVLRVQARPTDAGVPYALLARLLRQVLAMPALALEAGRARELALVLPELGEAAAVAGDAQRLLLQRAVDATLAQAMPFGLRGLLIDDLHFADAASVGVLQALALSDRLAALRWGLARRPAEADDLRPTALAEAGRIETVTLAPLDDAQMAALIDSLGLPEIDAGRLAPILLRHTGGNPMFALETLKDLVLSGQAGSVRAGTRLPQPVTVGALVERRLAQLSKEALRLARTAALAGPDFDAELAAAVLELHPLDIAEPWRELEAAQVIRDGAFAHDLVFEATRASVPRPIAQLLHRRIATHLLARQAPPERLAPHWAGAGDWARAGEAYAAAARRAQRASQRRHEVEGWAQAADAFDRAGLPAMAFAARCDSVPALIVVRGVTEANTVIDRLVDAATGDAERAAALTARATAALMAADHAAGIAAAAEAGRLAAALDTPWPRFEAERLHAVGLAQAGRSAEALALIEPWRARIDADASDEQRGHFWADYAYVLNGVRRLRDTAFALQQATALAQSAGDLAELATLTSNLATVRGNLGELPQALALARRALGLQAQLGATNGPEGAVVATYVGLYSAMSGQYREALERFDAAIDCFARDGQAMWLAVASNHKAMCLIDLGQFARARQALAYPRPPIDHVRARGASIAARLARSLGQPADAPMRQALAELSPIADPHVRMHVLLDAAEDGDPGFVLQRCDEVLAIAQQLEFAGVVMKARLLRALAQSRAGDTAAAATAMRALVAQLPATPPADLYPARAWWLAAQVFEASGDGDHALMALAHGAQWVRRVALPEVPEDFRDSFLHRNPINRLLLAAADRRHAE